MARINLPPQEALTKEQAAAIAEVVSGPRGKVPAPMVAWLQSPELARRLQKVGELLRYDTSLEPRLTELAILVCARHWTADVQWNAHKPLALRAGLDPLIIADIAARRKPDLSAENSVRAAYEICSSLLSTGHASDDVYRQAVTELGERGVVELIATLGYYCLASFTLNAFQLDAPTGIAPDLESEP